jgi:hypothetical protein
MNSCSRLEPIDTNRPIRTRDGRQVTIITAHGRGHYFGIPVPLMGYVENDGETIWRWSANGRFYPSDSTPSPLDIIQEAEMAKLSPRVGTIGHVGHGGNVALAVATVLAGAADASRSGANVKLCPPCPDANARSCTDKLQCAQTGLPTWTNGEAAPAPAVRLQTAYRLGLCAAKDIAWREYKDNGKSSAAYAIHQRLLKLVTKAEHDLKEMRAPG